VCSPESNSLPGLQGLSFCGGNIKIAQQRLNTGIFFSELKKETLCGHMTPQMTFVCFFLQAKWIYQKSSIQQFCLLPK